MLLSGSLTGALVQCLQCQLRATDTWFHFDKVPKDPKHLSCNGVGHVMCVCACVAFAMHFPSAIY